jgi:hypothetical protein
MFRNEMLDMRQPALVEATALAMRALAGPLVNEVNSEGLTRDGAIRIAAGCAYAHGLAVLLADKRLRGVSKRAPAFPIYKTSPRPCSTAPRSNSTSEKTLPSNPRRRQQHPATWTDDLAAEVRRSAAPWPATAPTAGGATSPCAILHLGVALRPS